MIDSVLGGNSKYLRIKSLSSPMENFRKTASVMRKRKLSIVAKSLLAFNPKSYQKQPVNSKYLVPTASNPHFLSPGDTKKSAQTIKFHKRKSINLNPSRLSLNISASANSLGINKTSQKILHKIKTQATVSKHFRSSKRNISKKASLETISDPEDTAIRVEFQNLHSEINEKYCTEVINIICAELALTSYKELSHATMILFASSVLDKYIIEAVNLEIKDIARKEFNLAKEAEYAHSMNTIVSEFFQEDLEHIISELLLIRVASLIASDYCSGFEYKFIIDEAIQEEIAQNKSIVEQKCQELIEEFINDEWIEILAEDEVNVLMIHQNLALFPPALKKEYLIQNYSKINERISEDIYFGYLNSIVGNLWLVAIVNSFIKECENNY